MFHENDGTLHFKHHEGFSCGSVVGSTGAKQGCTKENYSLGAILSSPTVILCYFKVVNHCEIAIDKCYLMCRDTHLICSCFLLIEGPFWTGRC